MTGRVHHDVLARGLRLRVVEEGRGPVLLLLHGVYTDHSTWDGLIQALGPDLRSVAPDLPGFGESEKPPPSRFPYTVEAFAEAILDLYAGLGLARAAVVGHGVGGAVAIWLTARHPELVSKLVLVDALCHEAPPDWATRLVSLPVAGGFVIKQLSGRALFRAFFHSRVLSPGADVPLGRIDHYYDLFNSPAARGSALATLRATADTRSVVAQTQRLQADTLIIWGRHDRILPAALGQRLAREISGSRLDLIDAGHAPHEERPAEVGALVRGFLAG